MKQELAKLDRARLMLSEVSTAMEAKKVGDVAAGLEVVAIKQKDEEVFRYARSIHADALRLEGDFLKSQPKAKGAREPGTKRGTTLSPGVSASQTLKQQGINFRESVEAQAISEAAMSQKKLFEAYRSGQIPLKAVLRFQKRKKQEAEIKKAQEKPKPVLIEPPYDLILADPPWRYEHCESGNREIENQYPTASLEEIRKQSPASGEDSILFLWATAPKLAEALSVMEAWGFSYRSCAVWDKEKIGMGYWWRIQHELLLVGVKGNAKATPESERVPSIFREERRKHSQKPECVYQWIERAFPSLKKLEMYCRNPRPGWAVFGNEV